MNKLVNNYKYNRRNKVLAGVLASFLVGTVATIPAQAAPSPKVMSTEAAFDVPAGQYTNDKDHTNVLWTVTHFGLSHYYGRFDNITADLDLNADDITKSRLHVDINPMSVDTNHTSRPNMFNKEIAGDKFLDAAKFPHITFDSTKIILTGEKTGKVEGDLKLHGVTKPVTLDVTFNKSYKSHPMTKTAALGFSAKTSFKRSDFGVSAFVPAVSDEVNVTIETEFTPKASK